MSVVRACELATSTNPKSADLERQFMRALLAEGDLNRARKVAERLDSEHDPLGSRLLGFLEEFAGSGQSAERQAALAAYQRAMSEGDLPAIAMYVRLRIAADHLLQPPETLIALLRDGAEKGDPQCRTYYYGYVLDGLVKDSPSIAFDRTRTTALSGFRPAMLLLADMYERAFGTDASAGEAEAWRARASEGAVEPLLFWSWLD